MLGGLSAAPAGAGVPAAPGAPRASARARAAAPPPSSRRGLDTPRRSPTRRGPHRSRSRSSSRSRATRTCSTCRSGTLIFRAGLIAPQQLEDALAEGLRTGKRLGEVLLSRGWLTELDLGRLLAGQKGLPFLDISTVAIDPNVSRRVPIEDCRRLMALPLLEEFGVPIVALADPNEDTMETMRRLLGTHVRFVVSPPSILAQRIEMAAGGAPRPACAPPPPVLADPALFEQTAPAAARQPPSSRAGVRAAACRPAPAAPETYEQPAPSVGAERLRPSRRRPPGRRPPRRRSLIPLPAARGRGAGARASGRSDRAARVGGRRLRASRARAERAVRR